MIYYNVLVTLCNVLFSNVAYTSKLMALTCSILGTFYVIQSRDASYMLIVFFGALSIQAIGFYSIAFKKLFEVPGTLETLKNHCSMLVSRKETRLTPWKRKVLQYRIRIIPKIGIKDGGFRILESETLLLFIDFYLNSVISLLLM